VWNLERLQHVEDAIPTLDRVVEIEVESRRMLEDDALRQLLLQTDAPVMQLRHGRALLVGRANDADEHMRLLQVGRDVDLLHGDELRGKGKLAPQQLAELAF